jgi:dipeptidyl aminopeptidase/acylaminoacyl peptidase
MLRRPFRWLAASLWATAKLAVVAQVSTQPPESVIRASDLLRIKQLGAPAISPDGRQVVYTVRSIEPKPERRGEYVYRTHLWAVDLDGRNGPRRLTRGEGSVSSPVWHPTGDRLAFVRMEKDKPQIWVLPMAPAGEAFPITRLPRGAQNPRWSPDGTRLLFSTTLTYNELRRELEKAPSANATATWPTERPGRKNLDTAGPRPGGASTDPVPPVAPDPEGSFSERRSWLTRNEMEGEPLVTSRLDFLGEVEIEPAEEFTHLYVVDAVENAEPTLLTPGFINADDAAWISLPEGGVVFSSEPDRRQHPDRATERALWLAVAGKAPQRLLYDRNFAYQRPTPSPDGRTIAFLAEDLSQPGYGLQQVGVVPAIGGAKKILTAKLDRGAARPKWSRDGRHLYFTAATNGGHPLYRVPSGGGEVERLTGISDGARAFDLHGQTGAVVLTTQSNPGELHRADLTTKEFRLLTSHNSEWLRTKALAFAQKRQVVTVDGIGIDTWLIKPAYVEPGKKYPLLVLIHGGPQAMWGPGDAAMWHEFQYWAGRGYGIVYCNPRGSSGYGYDFQRANYQDWSNGPAGDVLAAVDAVSSEPWIDKDRLVIAGGSYGGYLTTWIIAHDRRFKAAIAQRGIYDLATFFGEGNAWRLVPYQFGGYPWEPGTRRLLIDQSPFTYVNRIETPLMIKHADADRRIGDAQSEMLYRALKVLGRPVEYVRYPHANHELSRSGDPRQRIDRLVRFDEFFRRFIGE